MKSLCCAVLLVGVTLCFGCEGETASSAPASSTMAVATETATFDVEGMTCSSCNLTVKIAAQKVDGVTEASASFDSKQAQVRFDPARTSADAIGTALTEAGYRATLVAPKGG